MATIDELIDLVLAPSPTSAGAGVASPLTEAATQRFLQNALPVLQNEAQLRGLQDSPAFLDTVGRSLATTLPQFITADFQNQRTGQQLASNLLLGGTGLGLQQQQINLNELLGVGGLGLQQQGLQQSAAGLSASIADTQRGRQLEATGLAGNLLNQFASNVLLPAAAQQTETAFTGLEGLSSLGDQQKQIEQDQFNAVEAEKLQLANIAQLGAFGAIDSGGVGQFLGQIQSGK